MSAAPTDIWQFERGLTRRLLIGGGASTLLGIAFALVGSPFWRGLGLQFAGWGAIDALLALVGRKRARARAAEPEGHAPQQQAEEARRIRGILLFNAGLDVGYVTGGLVLVRTKGRDDPFWRGSGYGIALQGAFLLLVDLIHGLLVPQRAP
jgi:membrane protein implicated in regulation of membrane protease activity